MAFGLYGLVLGMAITEVLGGFSRLLRHRGRTRIGWQVPLLGVVVLLDLTTFWMDAYQNRAIIPVNQLTLFVAVVLVGCYYLIAGLVFPDDIVDCPDLDDHYARHVRVVAGGMLAISFIMQISFGILEGSAAPGTAVAPEPGTVALLLEALTLPILVALLFVRKRRLTIPMLVILIVAMLAGAAFD